MTTRALLFAGVTSLAFVAVLAALLPIAKYGRDVPGPGHGMLAVDLSDLGPGEYKVVDRAADRTFVLRDASDRITVLRVPLIAGSAVLPGQRGNHHDADVVCRNFGPESRGRLLVNGGRFACRDEGLTGFGANHYLWAATGEYVGPALEPLAPIPARPFLRRGGSILIGAGE